MPTPVESSATPTRLDAAQVECLVFTFKEGVLSAVGHDLKLRVTAAEVELGPGPSVRARFEARSLKVVCAREAGRDAPLALSARDRQSIEKSLAEEVLRPDRHPLITFVSHTIAVEGERARVQGSLEVLGVARPLAFEARREGGRWLAEVRLHQPDFGIKPFTAMLGALKVRPDLEVRISLPG